MSLFLHTLYCSSLKNAIVQTHKLKHTKRLLEFKPFVMFLKPDMDTVENINTHTWRAFYGHDVVCFIVYFPYLQLYLFFRSSSLSHFFEPSFFLINTHAHNHVTHLLDSWSNGSKPGPMNEHCDLYAMGRQIEPEIMGKKISILFWGK